MSEGFVPFQPKQDLGLADSKPSFQQLKPEMVAVVPAGVSTEPQMVSTPASAMPISHQHTSPQVTLQREGDKVMGIRVECGCGQVVMLDCVY